MALALCLTLLPAAALAEGKETEVTTADALATALNGDAAIIKLTANIEISAMLTVNRTVTLDLNDHVLKMTGTGRVIEVKNGVNLTLVDNAETKTEKYFNKDSTGLWTLATGTTENTVNGGVITGGNTVGNTGGGVRIVSGGAFTMTGGNIVGCTAGAGGGVDVRGTFTMTGGSIAGCVATNGSGGGVFVEDGGTFAMTGGSVAGCTAVPRHMRGGGISNAGTTTLSGSAKIQNCHVQNDGYGGGVFSASGKNLTVNHVEITGCTRGKIPDAMHFKNGTVSGGIFDGEVTNQGGTISGGTFNSRVVNEGNIENGMFNGEVVNQSNCTIKDGTFKNTVDNFGTIGGGTFTETSTVNNEGTIEKGEFSGKVENQTGGTIGGGMFSGTVTNNGTISGGTFAVTFDTNGGSIVPVENVLNGQKATKPTNPTKTGYTFDGWYTEETCTNPYDFDTSVQNALTLYAKWTINQYTITFKPENGGEDTTITQDYGTAVTAPTVKVELPQNSGKTEVEIPVSNANAGTVAIIVRADGTEEIIKNSVPTEDGIRLTVDGSATVKIVDNAKGFIDTQTHWAKDEIDFVSARELVNGISATRYAPDATATRAQMWTILARQNDADLTGGANWYEKAQLWSKDKGISDGTNPGATITRAQMVTMLWRTMGQPAAGGAANFNDVPANSYYAQAVAWAVESGITTGVGNGRFDPNSTCTRAQIAAFLARSMK